MNSERRKQIEAIKERISSLVGDASEILSEVEDIRNDEQDYRDNMPESFADGDKGQKADDAIAALDEVVDGLQTLLDTDFDGQLCTAAE